LEPAFTLLSSFMAGMKKFRRGRRERQAAASNSDFGKIQGLVWPQQGILATLFHFGRIFVS
jgi:hypothetical protein